MIIVVIFIRMGVDVVVLITVVGVIGSVVVSVVVRKERCR